MIWNLHQLSVKICIYYSYWLETAGLKSVFLRQKEDLDFHEFTFITLKSKLVSSEKNIKTSVFTAIGVHSVLPGGVFLGITT